METGWRETRGSCVEEEDSRRGEEKIARGRHPEKETEVEIETTPENIREHILLGTH